MQAYPLFIVIISALLVLAFLFIKLNKESEKLKQESKRLKSEKAKFKISKLFCGKTQIPNSDYFFDRLKKMEVRDDYLYYHISMISIDNNSEVLSYFSSEQIIRIKEKLYDSLRAETDAKMISLYQDRFFLVLFASKVPFKKNKIDSLQQSIFKSLPTFINIGNGNIDFKYYVTTLVQQRSTDLISRTQVIEHLKFGLAKAYQSNDHNYLFNESDYQYDVTNSMVMRSLLLDIANHQSKFYIKFQPVASICNIDSPLIYDVSLHWDNLFGINENDLKELTKDKIDIQQKLTRIKLRLALREVSDTYLKVEPDPRMCFEILRSELCSSQLIDAFVECTAHNKRIRKNIIFSVIEDCSIEQIKKSNRCFNFLKKEGVSFVTNRFVNFNESLLFSSCSDYNYIKFNRVDIENLITKYSLDFVISIICCLEKMDVKVIVENIESHIEFESLRAFKNVLIKGTLIGGVESSNDFKVIE